MDVVDLFRQDRLILFILVALRTCGAMAVGPLASWPGVPANIRLMLGLGVALALVGTVPTSVPPTDLHPGIFDLARELGIGLMFGVASSLVVSVLQLAAGLVDFQAGFTFGATIDPMSGQNSGPLEHFLTAFSTVLCFSWSTLAWRCLVERRRNSTCSRSDCRFG